MTENEQVTEAPAVQPAGEVVAETPAGPPPGYEQVPPELWPDKDGKPPQLTEKLLRRLRGKYFTVKHPTLTDCGHRLDMINEPNHRNCENCWFQFFNTHPQLVEVSDQFFRTHGKNAMIGMRGLKFVKMFCRYMATIIEFARKEGRLPSDSNQGQDAPSTLGDGTVVEEAGASSANQAADQSGEVGSGRISSGLVEEAV